MEIVEGEFPVGKKHQWRYTKQETFPIKKSPPCQSTGRIFLFHLIVIVLIQASCKVEEGRGVGGVD